MCANVTCLQRVGLGCALFPRTGVILNNMLGEEGPQPPRLSRDRPGSSGAVDDGARPWCGGAARSSVGLGSAGSNRIRIGDSADVVRAVEQGMGADEAVRAPRLHFEQA
jgi:gamma-glutamyltranspeptidase/glutathione hydrolase